MHPPQDAPAHLQSGVYAARPKLLRQGRDIKQLQVNSTAGWEMEEGRWGGGGGLLIPPFSAVLIACNQ